MKKFIILLFIITCSLVVSFFHFKEKALLLKNHYTVWDFSSKEYHLVRKMPKAWVSLKNISEEAKWAIVISEDWAFYEHNGIDFNQLKIVIEESLSEGELVRGASTITQQVVKNALLSQERTILRKLKEMILSLLVDYYVSKDKILEQYVNLIELGEDLFGIQNASYFYFQRPAKSLNAKEGAFLAMLLPSPIRYSQSYRKRKLTPFAAEQISKILEKLRLAKKITVERKEMLESQNLSFEVFKEEDVNLESEELHTQQ